MCRLRTILYRKGCDSKRPEAEKRAQQTHNEAGAFAYHCCRAKAINITYSVCASVALVMQYANRKHRIITRFSGKI